MFKFANRAGAKLNAIPVNEKLLYPLSLRNISNLSRFIRNSDRLCGLVVRVLFYKSGGPGSIPGTTRKKK
jgi:hypothetical protein